MKKKSILGDKERETLYIVEECNCEEFKGCQYVLLFFSAGWCPPCEQFLQVLKDFYSEVNIGGKIVEVLYISADKKEQDFKETYAKMPWLTYQYNNVMRTQLLEQFNITGVPIVYVCDASTGFVITYKGRKDICELGVSCMKNWSDEMPDMQEKVKHLTEGAKIVEEARIEQEKEEARRKAQAEKENE